MCVRDRASALIVHVSWMAYRHKVISRQEQECLLLLESIGIKWVSNWYQMGRHNESTSRPYPMFFFSVIPLVVVVFAGRDPSLVFEIFFINCVSTGQIRREELQCFLVAPSDTPGSAHDHYCLSSLFPKPHAAQPASVRVWIKLTLAWPPIQPRAPNVSSSATHC